MFHIEYPRLVPERRPSGHQPAAPRYTLRWQSPPPILISQYHGMQVENDSWTVLSRFIKRMTDSFAEADGPSAYEVMRFTDEAGYTNVVVASYWTNGTKHARWMANSTFSQWLTDDERLFEEAGYWNETIAVPYDRHETIYSGQHYRIGLGRLPGTKIEPMTTNGYFGAARDRIPISAIDPLDSPYAATSLPAHNVESKGRRLFAAVPLNMTALRSGQFWESAQPEQLADYVENLQPKLMRGMDYLTQHKGQTGTLSLRVMTNLAEDGTPRRETSVLAYFLSLAQLEDWAKSHETHLDIYWHAIAMNRKYSDRREVITWHEVFLMLGGTTFEYINCHPRTGLLPFTALFERAK